MHKYTHSTRNCACAFVHESTVHSCPASFGRRRHLHREEGFLYDGYGINSAVLHEVGRASLMMNRVPDNIHTNLKKNRHVLSWDNLKSTCKMTVFCTPYNCTKNPLQEKSICQTKRGYKELSLDVFCLKVKEVSMLLLRKSPFSAIFEDWPKDYPKVVRFMKIFVAHHNFIQ